MIGRYIDHATGQVGEVHRSRFTGTIWFTPDDAFPARCLVSPLLVAIGEDRS